MANASMAQIVASHMSTEQLVELVESRGMVVINHGDLLDLYGELREMSEGRGMHKKAAETAISYLFEELGEPGAGE